MSSVSPLRQHLEAIVAKDRILDSPIERIAHASDASFYRLVPQAVVLPQSVAEVQGLFSLSHQLAMPLTFRSAGTSLSGQAVSDGLLVDISRHFRGVEVLDLGERVKVQPGAIGAHVNRALKPYGRKMGPDPASINTCQMGGILSNNASGMCCGVAQNAYHTLQSITFLLPSGTLIDTAHPHADERLRVQEPALHAGLLELRARILADPELSARIRSKYRMKNTTGYSLNAFVDHERPVDILAHLLVGAEGTLAFIAEAVLHTVPDLPVKHTGLLLFKDLYAACAAIVPLRDAGAKALELMDRASLRSVQDKPGMPASLKLLGPEAAGLLVEFQAEREADRPALAAAAREAAGKLELVEPALFTDDAAEQAKLWRIRQGMFPSVGAVRASGTTVIIEDVAFPIERLADAAVDLTKLFRRHGYDEAIIFGHAKDGNLHFVITQGFAGPREVERYERFIDDLVELVVQRYDGALKAEHGTGRNMAPFVETEWGGKALEVMRRLKELCDPTGLLNPGVIVPAGPRAHLDHLKALPSVEAEVDKCIECGFCEPRCPSRELTLTPRQRIVVRREMARLKTGAKGPVELADLAASAPYMVMDTCAVDGLCATACPVGIDTGQLVKRLRHEAHSVDDEAQGHGIAEGMDRFENLIRLGLRVGNAARAVLGDGALSALTRATRSILPLPVWTKDMPHSAPWLLPRTEAHEAKAIYFPSCISRTMGHLPGEPSDASLVETMLSVSARAGLPLHIPSDVEGVCCGVPFSSKGYVDGHRAAANAAIEKMWRWTDGGRLPVVVDTSPCTYGLLHADPVLSETNKERWRKLRILDGVQFAHDELLPRLTIQRKARSVALHPVCSLVKMELTGKLEGVARACSESVTVPADAGCCGFAGDRGFLVPELTASATRAEAAQVNEGAHDGCYSSSRTCEIGMTRATGQAYRSFIYLLEEATRA